VKYQFSTPGAAAPGYPIIGPGAQVQVTYGTNGGITRLHYAARRFSEGKTVAVISPGLASERVATCSRVERTGNAATGFIMPLPCL